MIKVENDGYYHQIHKEQAVLMFFSVLFYVEDDMPSCLTNRIDRFFAFSNTRIMIGIPLTTNSIYVSTIQSKLLFI